VEVGAIIGLHKGVYQPPGPYLGRATQPCMAISATIRRIVVSSLSGLNEPVQPRLNLRKKPITSGTIPTNRIAAATDASDPAAEITSITHLPSRSCLRSLTVHPKRHFPRSVVKASAQGVRGSADFFWHSTVRYPHLAKQPDKP